MATPDVLEDAVRRHFGDWTGHGTPTRQTRLRPAGRARDDERDLVSDPQAPNQLALNWITPHDDRPDTLASYSTDLTRAVACKSCRSG